MLHARSSRCDLSMQENGLMLYSSFIPLYIGDKPPSILIPTGAVDTRQRLYRLNVPCCIYLGVEGFDILKFCRFGKFFIHFFPD